MRCAFVAAALVLSASVAHAAGTPLVVSVDDGAAVDAPALRAALAEDLGVAVDLGARDAAVRIERVGDDRVRVVVTKSNRTIDLPRDRALAAQTVAFAASALVRDEASELLVEHAKGTAPAVEGPAPAAPPPPSQHRSPCDERWSLPFTADFAPYVGTSSVFGPEPRAVALNVVAGYGRGLHGFEIAGAANVESRFACGAQIAGAANVVTGPVRGAQIATVNVAGDVGGAQIGVANVATGPVRGVQIGVVNYAEDSDASIGLVSIVKNGRTSAEAWGTESGLSMVGIRHGGRVVHNVFGVGYRVGPDRGFAFSFGIGVRASLAPRLVVDFDLLDYVFNAPSGQSSQSTHIAAAQASLGWSVTDAIGIFAAPSFDVLVSDDKSLSYAPLWGSAHLAHGTTRVDAWPGLALGARVNL